MNSESTVYAIAFVALSACDARNDAPRPHERANSAIVRPAAEVERRNSPPETYGEDALQSLANDPTQRDRLMELARPFLVGPGDTMLPVSELSSEAMEVMRRMHYSASPRATVSEAVRSELQRREAEFQSFIESRPELSPEEVSTIKLRMLGGEN